ncbi:MAG: hypothetical protein UR61_C0018G0010 [candidate division WS6 bacterium GW2011_GWE1_34_7]|uniref:Uncharacterized protein n=1 Tax=candidate division WS6 bacterium GW2011_GWE1_34_7 TaxID=1619093 RepID=A0A0G0DR75_9BACT|nr:MAG: hypothetical protein UR61_C0018G0010 [candidate division WS6 bacterium GW2011_GWE1_34_7]
MGLVTSQSKQKREQEMAAVSQKVKKTKLSFSDLVIPIASGILFIILAFAVFIPMVTSAFEYLDEIKETNEKIDQLEKLNKQIDSLDDNQLNDDVLTSRQVIPRILLVSNFVFYLDELAKEKSLEISELSSADSINGVSGPIGYTGDYLNVIAFLEDVQSVSPYMIRLENVEVSAKEEGDWSISLQVSGYYILEADKDPDIYAPFQPYTEYEDVVEIFKRKAESID